MSNPSQHVPRDHIPELLAPAGGPEAGYAAIEYGADAIYLGLRRFSARAEAENFSADELSDIVGYAHALSPRRKVFVTVNTLVLDREIDELIESLAAVADIGADAVVVQDLGVARIARESFPSLRLHASTQLAIHNLAGAEAARDLGFKRVTLARELTLEEVREFAASAGVEVEVFVHGALCYCYSGLCLYSSLLRGRSGNRGRCLYPCRDLFREIGASREGLFPFSMKDLALSGDIDDVCAAGVASLKIEGRKKSALYVAAVTNLYRKLLDGPVAKRELERLQGDIQTIFSRPLTTLFARGERNRGTVDTQTVGHRGTPIGRVEMVTSGRGSPHRLRLRTDRPLERHDGIQVDLPEAGRPFGFAVDSLYLVNDERGRAAGVIEAPAGARVEVELPAEHPLLPAGALVYCSSSQAVKRAYAFSRPKAGEYRVRLGLDVTVEVTQDKLSAHGHARDTAGATLAEARGSVGGVFAPARTTVGMEPAVEQAFGKLGDTPFVLRSCALVNPGDLFVPVSVLNAVRRELTGALDDAVRTARKDRLEAIRAAHAAATPMASRSSTPKWSLRVDSPEYLADFDKDDIEGVEEIVVDVGNPELESLTEGLGRLAAQVGRERVRLALPMITRRAELPDLRARLVRLSRDGWRRWEAANVGAWAMLREASCVEPDMSADWSVYVVNRAAARQVLAMGARRFVLSPDDGPENMRALVRQFSEQATVTVFADPPLFISESCACAALADQCADGGACRERSVSLESSKGEKVLLVQRGCRSVVLGGRPLSLVRLVPALREAGARHLRADFVYRAYSSELVAQTWRAIRSGKTPPTAADRRPGEIA